VVCFFELWTECIILNHFKLRRVITRSKSCHIPVLYCHGSQFDFIKINFEAVSSKETNNFDNAHNLLSTLCNAPILRTEELRGPHTHIHEFLRSEPPLPRLGDEHNPSYLPLSIYTYAWMCVYNLHAIYVLQFSHFLCTNSTYTHLFSVSLCPCLTSTNPRKYFE
jgi:hypothetical protein